MRTQASILAIFWASTFAFGCSTGGGATDAGLSDGGSADAGSMDAGVMDAGSPDAGNNSGVDGNQVNGTVLGQSLAAMGAVNTTGGQSLQIVIGNIPNLCTALTNNSTPKNASLLIFTIEQTDGAGDYQFPPPGDYTVVQGIPPVSSNVALVVFQTDDAMCNINQALSASATSGTVHLTAASMSGGPATGTFDLSFDTDHLTGSFNAESCQSVGQMATCQ